MPSLSPRAALRLPLLSTPVFACLAVFLLATRMPAQTPVDPGADFAEPFKGRYAEGGMLPVIQASPTDDAVPAVLFGPFSTTGDLPKLTAELVVDPEVSQQPWKLEFPEVPNPTGDPPLYVLTPEKKSSHWVWEGKIKLTRQGTAAPRKRPEILFKLGDKETRLIPSEIWYIAGGGHLSATQAVASTRESGIQILEPVQQEDTLIWQQAKSPGVVARAFVRELRSNKGFEQFPVTVYCVTSPRTFLADWLQLKEESKDKSEEQPKNKPWVTAALWHPSTSWPASPVCRGMIWWHGEWEADCHPDVNDDALAAGGMNALDAFRQRYASELQKLLTQWTTENPSSEIRVVQLPSVNHRTADRGFHVVEGGTDPLSSWSAIRYAQYDAVKAVPRVSLYPLLPAAPGAPGYQKPEASEDTPPSEAWAESFGERGVGSQLETVGAALARRRSTGTSAEFNGHTATVTGLQPLEKGSVFRAADLFEAFSAGQHSMEPTEVIFPKEKGERLLVTYPKPVTAFRTKAADEVYTLRTTTGELIPAFSIPSPKLNP